MNAIINIIAYIWAIVVVFSFVLSLIGWLIGAYDLPKRRQKPDPCDPTW